jgi:pimeloyl-ACP methyl ester carboxylesterase
VAISIVYLHGVGQGVARDDWYRALAKSLEEHGVAVPPLQSKRIIRPSYIDLLQGVGVPASGVREPTPTIKEPGSRSEKLTNRASFARRQAEAIAGLPEVVTNTGFAGVGRFVGQMDPTGFPLPLDLSDAKHYLRNERVRWSILHKVIDAIGTQRDLIIVGHSLGSLVAIDLLAHLPPDIRIRRLVTIGSPAGAMGILY